MLSDGTVQYLANNSKRDVFLARAKDSQLNQHPADGRILKFAGPESDPKQKANLYLHRTKEAP
jgi:hypothetical protein